ncbi:hypothetical protein GFS03_05010 [Sulfolobus sp. E5-1-F]|uniref:hypothetical protein n=1 Tax=Saccharolobus sp. E5-1-F TaxID=2663019 RepID=UPI001297D759|nr:hypothetical protein [Sulfolobus sp. E5-1-F]QGA53980.1 hypothetical protein GFS03_05010 [Sulfolobus sp. E5-1-F]
MIDEKALKEWIERFNEAKEIRRKYADWDFIRSQPTKIRIALEYYVETGDLYNASKISGMSMEEFNELRIRARIPSI